jgi:GTP-binding protein LepA
MSEQVLDSMDLERERGITIKAQTAALSYKARDGQRYNLNLIDTPGHVDFSYEVSRSLSACEGALLVVDASQGVEAQTVANCYTAIELGVEVLPVLNKMDLPSANPDKARTEIEDVIGIDAHDAIAVQRQDRDGRDGCAGARDRTRAAAQGRPGGAAAGADHRFLVRQLRRRGDAGARGQRQLKPKDKSCSWRPARSTCASMSACSRPSRSRARALRRRGGLRHRRHQGAARRAVGDTLTSLPRAASSALPGFKEVKPQVFAGLFPVESNQYEALRDALDKLQLNDSALRFEPEVSQALGFGFRCGFLGLLHMDIVQERLEREYDMDLITTAPSVVYEVLLRDGTVLMVENPSKMPDPSKIEEIREPIVTGDDLRAAGIRRCGHHAVHRQARRADQHEPTTAARCC